jgi:hypothetical protein
VDKRLIAGEKAVSAGEQIAFEPALAEMLVQHLHHPPVMGEVDVIGLDPLHPKVIFCGRSDITTWSRRFD